MEGPRILAQTLGQSVERGGAGVAWQYHGRSSLHARQTSWAIFFDMIASCDAFRTHVASGAVAFVLDYPLQARLPRKVHFAITKAGDSGGRPTGRTFAQLGKDLGIQLSRAQESLLREMPELREEHRDYAGDLLVAVEAKACMTDHIGAIPRLFAEMLATGYLVKQATPNAVAVAHALVNASDRFVTPSKKKPKKTRQGGPESVVRMIKEAIPTARQAENVGFDAVGVTVVNCVNDGSPVEVITGHPSPRRSEQHCYDWMISNLCTAYTAKFGRIGSRR